MQEDSISGLSHHLLRQWENGEQDAATKIFDRYVDRLVRLVNAKLASTMQARLDPEDVVQSAFREFFEKARKHEFVLKRSGALWSLLATITLNKLHGQIELQQAKKRSPSSEDRPVGPDLDDSLQFIDRDPTPQRSSSRCRRTGFRHVPIATGAPPNFSDANARRKHRAHRKRGQPR